MVVHSSLLTVHTVGAVREGSRAVTATLNDNQRVNQLAYIRPMLHLVPGDICKVTAQRPPEIARDRFGRRWFVWRDISNVERIPPNGRQTRKALLRLAGVGEKRSTLLWSAFGPDVLQVLLDPMQLGQVAIVLGGGAAGRHTASVIHTSALALSASEQLRQEEFDFYIWLEEHGVLEPGVARTAWRLLQGSNLFERLRSNPYVFAGLLDWKKADSLGRGLLRIRGISESEVDTHPERLSGALDSIARTILTQGHTVVSQQELLSHLAERNVPLPKGLLRSALAPTGGQFIWLGDGFQPAAAAWQERRVVERLKEFDRNLRSEWKSPRDITKAIVASEARAGMTLTAEQRSAACFLLQREFGLLVGGAGTGKTYTIRIIVDVFSIHGGNVVLAALAGKAALTLSQATGRLARTITRTLALLQRRHQREECGEEVPVDWPYLDSHSLLVLDEASMIDTPMFADILDHVPKGCRVLLVGDPGQLPPIGWGQLFHDLIVHNWNVATLNQILRQREGSSIALLAASIRSGRVPLPADWSAYPEVQFIEQDLTDGLAVVDSLVEEWGGFAGDNLMICAARRATVSIINESFSRRNHSEDNVIRLSANCIVAVGDPVVCTRNHYGDTIVGELRNGMLGVVTSITDAESGSSEIQVLWQGCADPRVVSGPALSDIELAFGITAHRSQGSAARGVIVIVERSPIVTRQWLYTAITRARERLWLVGRWRDLNDAVGRDTYRATDIPRLLEDLRWVP